MAGLVDHLQALSHVQNKMHFGSEPLSKNPV